MSVHGWRLVDWGLVKHAGPDALELLAPLIEQLRTISGLVEKRPGTFYRGSRAFLHFHEDPAGLFADVRLDTEFERHAVTTRREQRDLLASIRRTLAATGP